MSNHDFVIIGGGIVGLTIARALARRKAGTVRLLEKEPRIGLHSSGRNSGVLHAGIYYGAGTLKAKVCVSGARMMREYCRNEGITLREVGKVIVPSSERSAAQVDTLFATASGNGIRIEKIDAKTLHELEPGVVMAGNQAIYSPDTAVIDIKGVLAKLEEEVLRLGVTLQKGEEALAINAAGKEVRTARGRYGYGHLINAAGLHADKIAHMMGNGQKYRIVPFKGMYMKLRSNEKLNIRHHIYPMLDLGLPFLGVHFTVTVDNEVTVGPTATPALGRENYRGLEAVDPAELPHIFADLLRMVASNKNGFRRLVAEELRKYTEQGFTDCARQLYPSLTSNDLMPCEKVGIRAQLVKVDTMNLEMDFVVENGKDSTHILNAVSPAFTSSFAFAEMVLNQHLGIGGAE